MEEDQFVYTPGISRTTGIAHQIIATIIVSLGSFGLGEVFAWSAIIVFSESDGFDKLPTEDEKSWIVSLALLGALFSGAPSGFCVNRFGSQRAMTIFAVAFLLGWLLISFATNVWMMYFGRLITGFSGGAYTVIIPVYVSEIVEDSLRSPCGYAVVLGLVTGILFTFVLGKFFSWFILSLICSSGILLFICLSFTLPQSPRFLLSNGRITDARKSLQWLRGASASHQVETELNEIKRSVESQNEKKTGTWKLLLKMSNAKPTVMIILLFFFQQMSGINAITMFTVDIFKAAGPELDPNDATIIIGIIQLVFVVLSTMIINKILKKSLLIVSDITMSISLAALGVYYFLRDSNKGHSPENLAWLPITSVSIYMIAYSMGGGPLPWVFMNDCLPENIRATTSAIATSFYWIMAFVMTKMFNVMVDLLGYSGTFWAHSVICFFGAVFTLSCVPETKGKSLAEIQRYFGTKTENINDVSANTDRPLMSGNANEDEKRNNNIEIT